MEFEIALLIVDFIEQEHIDDFRFYIESKGMAQDDSEDIIDELRTELGLD